MNQLSGDLLGLGTLGLLGMGSDVGRPTLSGLESAMRDSQYLSLLYDNRHLQQNALASATYDSMMEQHLRNMVNELGQSGIIDDGRLAPTRAKPLTPPPKTEPADKPRKRSRITRCILSCLRPLAFIGACAAVVLLRPVCLIAKRIIRPMAWSVRLLLRPVRMAM